MGCGLFCQQPLHGRVLAARREPPVCQRLLDDHDQPGIVCHLQRFPGRRLQQIPGGLHRGEKRAAVSLQGQRLPDSLRLACAADGKANCHSPIAQPRQLIQHGIVFQDAALLRGRMDLVQIQVATEQGTAFLSLPLQHSQGMFFYFVLLPFRQGDLPAGRVRIPPFRGNGDSGWSNLSRCQPRGQELFRPAVRTGSIKITDARFPGRVEHGMGVGFHLGDSIIALQIGGMAQINVARPA